MPNDFNQQVIDEFRAHGGEVKGPFEGARLLLLTTTGARTGAPHTTPLGALPDGAGRTLVIASAGGAPHHPAWYHNVLAHPRVTVEAGVFTYEADAVVLTGEERDRAFARAVEADPGWAEYQARTTRTIPVVALDEIPGPPRVRAGSVGESLRLVHDGFRRELALIRAEVAASGPGIGAQLRINCLTLCQGLHNHHTGEDRMLFPALAAAGDPALVPVLDRLREEHERIAALIAELQRTVSAGDTGDAGSVGDAGGAAVVDRDTVAREVDRIIAELEGHLRYEEEQLIPVLDG
ncbi:nitroreductase/quinone reductase family protein [Streptomyces yaizuensis]|uniref:Nitroreductase/quinone reductase family protein n=1 Tax=Streptomyces yaizuensis TaxID=2989713 RepID=A0ABQ5P2V1_9ACTN|nr:nitroreductase/quinone reductase family protein [Streptomyces sp. YSPA8]GLF96933.1 nitroreductase/quinone reductase family protein [Streptomyces sp. YSPA8]